MCKGIVISHMIGPSLSLAGNIEIISDIIGIFMQLSFNVVLSDSHFSVIKNFFDLRASVSVTAICRNCYSGSVSVLE